MTSTLFIFLSIVLWTQVVINQTAYVSMHIRFPFLQSKQIQSVIARKSILGRRWNMQFLGWRSHSHTYHLLKLYIWIVIGRHQSRFCIVFMNANYMACQEQCSVAFTIQSSVSSSLLLGFRRRANDAMPYRALKQFDHSLSLLLSGVLSTRKTNMFLDVRHANTICMCIYVSTSKFAAFYIMLSFVLFT